MKYYMLTRLNFYQHFFITEQALEKQLLVEYLVEYQGNIKFHKTPDFV